MRLAESLALKPWQKQRSQNADDGDDHQELNEGEAGMPNGRHAQGRLPKLVIVPLNSVRDLHILASFPVRAFRLTWCKSECAAGSG